MKTLTEKITEQLEKHTKGNGSDEYKLGVHHSINAIKALTEKAEFEEVARELMKHLAKNYHPHTHIIITSTNAELAEGLKSTGKVMDYIPD